MGYIFARYQPDRCCLCGSPDSLTGEHKVKRSALKAIFGRDAMLIGRFGEDGFRSAQGPNSRAFHFNAPVCADCNNARTQASDQEFDRFCKEVEARFALGEAPSTVFDLARYAKGSVPYLNVFRYFAKLLCCHVAECGGPRSLELSAFALGNADRNPVFLDVGADPNYAEFASVTGIQAYAAHGGLMVPSNPKTRLPTGFRSSLTLGPIRYVFFVRYNPIVGRAIKYFHRDFWRQINSSIDEAIKNPLSDDQLRNLGAF